MCCRKVLELLTLKKCCCGIPLKAATYVTGSLMLMYCSFTELDTLLALCSEVFLDPTIMDDYMEHASTQDMVPAIAAGSGVGAVDYMIRHRDGFQMSSDYIYIFLRALIIGWTVINGFFIFSTCLMLYGNAKSKSILLLQWLVISATIAIGNLIDIIFAIIYMKKSTSHVFYVTWNGSIFHLLQCLLESGAIVFGFVVVRSHYYHLTLPSIQVSFKTLESRDATHEDEESEKT